MLTARFGSHRQYVEKTHVQCVVPMFAGGKGIELTFKLFSKDHSSHLGERYHRQQFISVRSLQTRASRRHAPSLAVYANHKESSGNDTKGRIQQCSTRTQEAFVSLCFFLRTHIQALLQETETPIKFGRLHVQTRIGSLKERGSSCGSGAVSI